MATKQQYVWMDGKLIKYEDATVPILTHSLQYGSGVFEGIRVYKTSKGPAVFRLKEHMRRFLNTARIYHMDLGFTTDQLEKAVLETVRKNGLQSCYVRPFAFYNDQRIGLAIQGKKVSVAIAAVDFGNYFSDKEKGIRCKVSSWHRINSEILPPGAKASGNYLNSIIASTEAKLAGADEAIMLGQSGFVAEGPGENIFLVENGNLVTPSKSSDILVGITRDSMIKVAESMGLEVEEREVHREELYTCGEVFFTGTAAEVTPIIEIDSLKIGNGKMGPITKMLSERFSSIVAGNEKEYMQWLTYV